MSRYSDYARDLRPISGVNSFSSHATILPLREFPQKCDPRRLNSYTRVLEIERSREDQPLLELSTSAYKPRRVVVPITRSQYREPSRIPNARDPRGPLACRKFNATSKHWKCASNWVPTLVENDQVLQEEETCAVLVIDVSEWESKALKHCYIDVVPHECNLQRALGEAQMQLAELLRDDLLMSPEEAEKHLPASVDASNEPAAPPLDDSDVVECDSDGETVPKRALAAVFAKVEDRPMLEVDEKKHVAMSSAARPRPRSDEDEYEDRTIYEEEKALEAPPVPKPDGADVECIRLDAEEEQPVKTEAPRPDDADVECIDDADELRVKKEPHVRRPAPSPDEHAVVDFIDLEADDDDEPIVPKTEATAPVDKNLQRVVLDVVTLDSDDEDEEEQNLVQVAMRLSLEESETNGRLNFDSWPFTCFNVATLPPDASDDLARESAGSRAAEDNGEKNSENDSENNGEAIAEASRHGEPSDYCVEQRQQQQQQQQQQEQSDLGCCVASRDCGTELAIGSDIFSDTVISESGRAENNVDVDDKVAGQTVLTSVGFGAATVTGSSDTADKASRSSDSDSDAPTTMQFETLAEVHVVAHSHSEVTSEMQVNSEEQQLATANVAHEKQNTRGKRKRLDTVVADEEELVRATCAIGAEDKRRKENHDDDDDIAAAAAAAAAADENKSDNCNALVDRASSPVFKTLSKRRKTRSTKKKPPSENVLQLSTTSTRVVSKPSVKHDRSVSCGKTFFSLGLLNQYLKNYTATYNCISFFCKNVERLSVFQFLWVSQHVIRNNAFWQNRYNHWHPEENNVFVADVTEKNLTTFNQLAIESSCASTNNQVASACEVQSREHKTVIEESAITTQGQQNFSIEKGANKSAENSWLVQGNAEIDDAGKIKLQRRHSLPMAVIPQQNLCTKRPRSESNDNPIKLTLRRSQADDNNWVATASTSTMPNISVQCMLSISNNSAEKPLGQVITKKDAVSVTNKASVNTNKVLPKWSCIDKEVPELELDDFVNRPLPQKIQFDKSILSLSLQSRVKKRSSSVDSAIVLDFDDNTCKRRKLADSTKEDELCMDSIPNYYNCHTGESLEITELSPDTCEESLRLPSENICNSNDKNNENTCKNSEKQQAYNLENLPKNCPTNTVILDQKCLSLNESNAPCLENSNHYFRDDTSSESNSSFHLHMEDDELDDSSGTAKSHDSSIQVDHNCNLQKHLNSFDKPHSESLSTRQNDIDSIEDLGKQKTSDLSIYTKKVDKLSKEFETLFGESNVEEVEKMIAEKYNCKKYQTDEIIHMQNDIQSDNSMETRLQSLEVKQSSESVVEKTCIKNSQLPALNLTESGSMNSVISNKEQEQEIIGGKDANSGDTLEKGNHIEILLNENKESALAVTSSENPDKIATSKSSSTSDVQSALPKNVDHQREACLDIQKSQALINGEKQTQVESKNTLESESSLLKDNQHSVIFNAEVESDISNCNINDSITSKQVFHDQSNKHFLDGKMNVANSTNAEHSPSKDKEILEYEKHQVDGKEPTENQEISNVDTPSTSAHQDQESLDIAGLEEGLEEGDFDFLASIHKIKINSEYDDDDYDVNSDCEELENPSTVEYSKDIDGQKLNASLVCNENVDTNNCEINVLEKGNQSSKVEVECPSTIAENKPLRNLRDSPLKATNVNAAESNSNNFIDINEEDDDIIIEYENINDSNPSKDVKPDISNNSTVEPLDLQTGSSIETMNSSDKLGERIPVSNSNLLHSSALNDCSANPLAAVASVINENNDQFSNPSMSISSTSATELTLQSDTNVDIDINNPQILEKFNLTKEIIAPEDVKTENSVTFENNDEEQTLCSTLESMLKDNSVKEYDVPKTANEQNYLNKVAEVPSKSSLVFEVSLPTEPQSGNDYDLLKALNVNLDNEWDVIVDQTTYKNSANRESSGGIKVKNVNDMLKELPNTPLEKEFSNENASSASSVPNVPQNSQHNVNCGVEGFQRQSNLPVNTFPTNNSIPNPYIIQSPVYAYIANQPLPVGAIQQFTNVCNVLPVPLPVMNNVAQQVQLPNQNNVQIPAPATTADKQIVLASSMFPGMFDSHATSSFCSKTVFNLQLPSLQNIILPPPYTILPSHNQPTISAKIENYKWQLLHKLIKTLTELENMDIYTIQRHIKVLYQRETLTQETWIIQKKMLTIAQCVGAFKKLTTEKNYKNIIEAIISTIHAQIRDKNLLKKIFGIFQKFKDRGIFKNFADEEQPLTLELGMQLGQIAIGMSNAQKEVLKYQIKIYQEMLKVNCTQLQSDRVPQLNNQKKNQDAIQRSSPMALQQNIVTTTVSPITDITNNSLQNRVSSQRVPCVSTESTLGIAKEQHGNEKQYPSIQKPIHSKAFASKSCAKCGKQSRLVCRCKVATYCSHDCQKRHWEVEHSTSCNSVNSAT